MNDIKRKLAAIREQLDQAAAGEHEIGNIVCALSALVDVVELLASRQQPDPDLAEYYQAKEQARRFLAAERGE